MAKRTVLKVDISGQKCKRQLFQAVSKLQGVDKIEINVDKGMLAVTGDADPIDIIMQTRKTYKFAKVVTIGPPPQPSKSDGDEEHGEGNKSDRQVQSQVPVTCVVCKQIEPHGHDPLLSCTIM
ncbi:hypothetical protein QJS10_CPA10g01330 [Acorus calamus]|uniref:HMA domain-containing protein n=1 Tax=Acorus calamus TaxID=4465 RepID=A0AAV9DXK6_ACOCL|nr:hypothetical protein QJS10_CPA10g01330 [Acorus calamus]